MAFYSRKTNAEQVQQYVLPFKTWLCKHAMQVARGDEDDRWSYLFIMDSLEWNSMMDAPLAYIPGMDYKKKDEEKMMLLRARQFLCEAKYVEWFYIDFPANTKVAIFWTEKGDKVELPTVLEKSLRIPKLSHLITLTPEDFFLVIRILYTSKIINGRYLKLNLNAAGLDEDNLYDDTSDVNNIITTFFKKAKVNYTIRTEVAMKQWIKQSDLQVLAELEPTPTNHLYAMQYITAMTQKDVYFFPTDSAVELALDWEQSADERYVLRPQED